MLIISYERTRTLTHVLNTCIFISLISSAEMHFSLCQMSDAISSNTARQRLHSLNRLLFSFVSLSGFLKHIDIYFMYPQIHISTLFCSCFTHSYSITLLRVESYFNETSVGSISMRIQLNRYCSVLFTRAQSIFSLCERMFHILTFIKLIHGIFFLLRLIIFCRSI